MARFVFLIIAVCMSYLISKLDAKPVADPHSSYMLLEIEEEDRSIAPMFRSADPEPIIPEVAAIMSTVPWAKVVIPATAVGAVGGGLYYVVPKVKNYFYPKNMAVKEEKKETDVTEKKDMKAQVTAMEEKKDILEQKKKELTEELTKM